MLNRIRSILRSSKFSVRDIKYLKRILKKKPVNTEVNFDELAYEFPGKTIEQLKEACTLIYH